MSLCIVLRIPDGGTLMATDTALSVNYEGLEYRVGNQEDDEKIIEHNGALIFCSGELQKCKKIRQYIKNMKRLNLIEVQKYAQSLYAGEALNNYTGILVCWEDGSLVGMLSAQNFKIVPLPWNKKGLDIQALGFHMQEASEAAIKAVEKTKAGVEVIAKGFAAALCEEVGGHLWFYSRIQGEPINKQKVNIIEPQSIRKKDFIELSGRQILCLPSTAQATDYSNNIYSCNSSYNPLCNIFADNLYFNDGSDVKTLLSQTTKKIDSSLLDLGNIKLDGSTGNITLDGDIDLSTGNIKWGNSFPIKFQYSPDGLADWHDTMSASDKFKRDSLNGGVTWGDPYQFKGEDGSDGSDASVPDWVKSIQSTYIDSQWVISPNIAGGNITALDKMEANCDFYVGNNIYLGKYNSGMKMLKFNETANIASETQDSLAINCETLDLTGTDHITWGNNAPVAVFGE